MTEMPRNHVHAVHDSNHLIKYCKMM